MTETTFLSGVCSGVDCSAGLPMLSSDLTLPTLVWAGSDMRLPRLDWLSVCATGWWGSDMRLARLDWVSVTRGTVSRGMMPGMVVGTLGTSTTSSLPRMFCTSSKKKQLSHKLDINKE